MKRRRLPAPRPLSAEEEALLAAQGLGGFLELAASGVEGTEGEAAGPGHDFGAGRRAGG